MNMWGIIWTVTAPLFFSGILVWLLRSWISIRLKNSIEHEYNEKLEVLKSQQQRELEKFAKILEKRNYVSKVRFDAEFQIYQELSKAIFDVVLSQNNLFTFYKVDRTPENQNAEKELYKERFETARTAYNSTMNCLHRNAPFIEKKIYDKFCELLKEAKRQLTFYPFFYINDGCLEARNVDKTTFEECNKRTDEISQKLEAIFFMLREYLQTLDVME